MKKVVVACDSFKGCVSSDEAGRACAEGVRRAFPGCEVVVVAIGDGGEGTAYALISALGAEKIVCRVHDPLMRPVEAVYGISQDRRTAIMEMASASGLALLKNDERNPLEANTYGTGEMIADALRRGCRHIILGLGGSATTDGGTGMLRALGYKFKDESGFPIEGGGGNLGKINSIDASAVLPEVRETEFTLACDVGNPLCGPRGAAHIFGPQKGADADAVERLEVGMLNFARVMRNAGLPDTEAMPGAGAAGGMGAACVAFLGGSLRSGIDIVLDALGFDDLLQDADLVITGEGRLDAQTYMGKAPEGILRRSRRLGVPVLAVGGAVEDAAALNRLGFMAALCIQPKPLPMDEAMRPAIALENIKNTVEQAVRLFHRIY